MFSGMTRHNWQDRPLPPRLKTMPPLTIPPLRPAARPLALLAGAVVAWGSGMTALPAQAQKTSEPASERQHCLGEAAVGLDKRIEACSALIGKSGARRDELIGFYLARGDAQREKRELQATIDDYGQVLKLDAGHLDRDLRYCRLIGRLAAKYQARQYSLGGIFNGILSCKIDQLFLLNARVV